MVAEGTTIHDISSVVEALKGDAPGPLVIFLDKEHASAHNICQLADSIRTTKRTDVLAIDFSTMEMSSEFVEILLEAITHNSALCLSIGRLSLATNDIGYLPRHVKYSNLKSLRSLDLSHNPDLKSLPTRLRHLASLDQINTTRTKLTGRWKTLCDDPRQLRQYLDTLKPRLEVTALEVEGVSFQSLTSAAEMEQLTQRHVQSLMRAFASTNDNGSMAKEDVFALIGHICDMSDKEMGLVYQDAVSFQTETPRNDGTSISLPTGSILNEDQIDTLFDWLSLNHHVRHVDFTGVCKALSWWKHEGWAPFVDKRASLRDAFRRYDAGRKGYLTMSELETLCLDQGDLVDPSNEMAIEEVLKSYVSASGGTGNVTESHFVSNSVKLAFCLRPDLAPTPESLQVDQWLTSEEMRFLKEDFETVRMQSRRRNKDKEDLSRDELAALIMNGRMFRQAVDAGMASCVSQTALKSALLHSTKFVDALCIYHFPHFLGCSDEEMSLKRIKQLWSFEVQGNIREVVRELSEDAIALLMFKVERLETLLTASDDWIACWHMFRAVISEYSLLRDKSDLHMLPILDKLAKEFSLQPVISLSFPTKTTHTSMLELGLGPDNTPIFSNSGETGRLVLHDWDDYDELREIRVSLDIKNPGMEQQLEEWKLNVDDHNVWYNRVELVVEAKAHSNHLLRFSMGLSSSVGEGMPIKDALEESHALESKATKKPKEFSSFDSDSEDDDEDEDNSGGDLANTADEDAAFEKLRDSWKARVPKDAPQLEWNLGNPSDGSYDGQWVGADKEGEGTYTWSNGWSYSGTWTGDRKEGSGTAHFVKPNIHLPGLDESELEGFDRLIYDGDIHNDQFHGRGRLCGTSSVSGSDLFEYDGAFQNGEFHGEGMFTWPDGSNYKGTFVKGEIQGEGTKNYADNSRYFGRWIGGMRHGHGVYTWECGEYEGEWKLGVIEGKGKMLYKDVSGTDAAVYEGGWSNGVRDGEGTYTWVKQNIVYKGRWKFGKRVGRGVYLLPDGKKVTSDEPEGGWNDKLHMA